MSIHVKAHNEINHITSGGKGMNRLSNQQHQHQQQQAAQHPSTHSHTSNVIEDSNSTDTVAQQQGVHGHTSIANGYDADALSAYARGYEMMAAAALAAAGHQTHHSHHSNTATHPSVHALTQYNALMAQQAAAGSMFGTAKVILLRCA
jgi:hypothetical protein